jgi:hypothetical protein
MVSTVYDLIINKKNLRTVSILKLENEKHTYSDPERIEEFQRTQSQS